MQLDPWTMDLRLLAEMPLFRELPPSELEHLVTRLRVVELPPETVLFREGERGDCFYVVLEGELEVFHAVGAEGERILAVRGRGEFIGELSLLNPDGLRTAGVRSRGPARLWEMERVQFDELIQRQPSLAYEMTRVLSARMTAAQSGTIRDLEDKNLQLIRAYEELKAAQAQIIDKERLERELQVAHDIQMSLLPQTLPRLPGYEFGARIIPERAVGGDFYDVIDLDSDAVAILVGDVTGKGVPAAIFMAQIHALLHAGIGLCSQPREALLWVNQQLFAIGASSLFATVLCGILDLKTAEFAFARAGHEPPLLVLAGGEVCQVAWDLGQPLGLLEDPVLDEQTVTIPPGGVLLLYSDGLTDGRNPQGEDFGRERLMDTLGGLADHPAQDVCNGLWQALTAFQGDAPQFDDVTLVAVRARAEEQERKGGAHYAT